MIYQKGNDESKMVNIYYIFSIQRSGTHLISNIIQNSYPISLYKNDCGCEVNAALYGSSYRFKHFDNNREGRFLEHDVTKISTLSNYKCIIFSCENCNSFEFLENSLEMFIEELNKIFQNYRLFVIQNTRDPRNINASMCAHKGIPKDYRQHIDKQYQFLNRYINESHEKFEKGLVVSNYEMNIHMNNAIFENMCKKLHLDINKSKTATQTVQGYGNGSTFTFKKKDTFQNYLTRYKRMEPNVVYKRENNSEHNELYNVFLMHLNRINS